MYSGAMLKLQIGPCSRIVIGTLIESLYIRCMPRGLTRSMDCSSYIYIYTHTYLTIYLPICLFIYLTYIYIYHICIQTYIYIQMLSWPADHGHLPNPGPGLGGRYDPLHPARGLRPGPRPELPGLIRGSLRRPKKDSREYVHI